MLHLNKIDRNVFEYAADRMSNDMASEPDEWNRPEEDAVVKMEAIAKGNNALVVTGDEIDAQRAEELMAQVLETEMAHWVPGSSPRLIWRAGAVLGFHVPEFIMRQGNPDCGPKRIQHPLYSLWIAKRYLMSCPVCGRLFP